MGKRILSLLLFLGILSSIYTTMPTNVNASMNIEIGDYIQMGTYYGQPILWRCVDIDENGPLILSDKILCLKPFDAKGANRSGSHGRGYYKSGINGYHRLNYGSDYWADSNMRSWLNSAATAGNVVWLCGNSPVENNVWGRYNEYAEEAGFLSNFTQNEIKCMKTVTQKSLLNGYEYLKGSHNYQRDTNDHRYDSDISNVVQNYDTALSEQVTDTMFLLDVKQVNEVYNNGNILGDNYYIGQPTAECVENSEYKSDDFATGKTWHYWLRSPYAGDYFSYGDSVRDVNMDGMVGNPNAYYSYIGVRPAFYLNLSSSNFWGGAGTESEPYIMEESKKEDKCYLPPISISDETFNFASGKKRNAEFDYDDNYFANSSYIYNHDLARFSMRLALASYAKKTGKGENKDYSQQFINVKNLLETCEFETIEWNTDYEEKPWVNGVGVIAGNKKIKYDSGDYTLIAVAIRGGGYEAEWGGNFNVGNGEHHAGFEIARNTVIGFIQDYIDFNEIEGNIKLLITGFSRAAATTNLTAAYFDDEPRLLPDSVSLTRDNLFAYCFETPAGVVLPDNESGLYDNIFSIVNQHDPVPMVAMREWDFDRYGKTLYLPAAQTNSNYGNLREKMIKLYDEYIGNNEEDVAEKDKKPYTIDKFSKYAYISTITHQYDLSNAQGVYLDIIVEKLANAIENATNYKNNYQEAFVYIGEELIGSKDTEEFVNYLLLDLTARLATKKSFYLTGSLISDKYIVRQALVDSFEYIGISVESEAIDVLLNLIIDLGFDDFITILKNFGNFGQAHYPELCMAWLDAMEETDFTDVRLRTLYVNCPVDVEVYDSNSNLVAAIYDNVPQQIDGSTIIAYVDDNEQKVVYLPQDEEYRVEVLATDEGEVTYTVQEQNISTGETKVINYNSMTVSKDDTLTGTIENLTTNENATYLLTSNSIEVSEAEVIENAEPIEITTVVEGNGVVNSGGICYKGEYVQVNAEPFDNEEFLGWYNGTELVSEEKSYRFQVTEALTLTAKFTENTCAVTLADSNDDIIDIIRVVKGNAVTLENTPEKESYTFDGLYKDNTLETALTVEDVFYEDTTLYVKWIKNIDITSALYTNDTVVVNATMVDNLVEKSGIVFIALYYDNRLVGLEKLAPNKDIGYTFENIEAKEDNYIVKIMYWDNMTKLMPLNNCEAATVQQ